MGRIKFSINSIYLIFIFFCTYFGFLKELVVYTLVLILHEFAHILIGKKLGYDFKTIKLNYYGAEAKTNSKFLEKHEFYIALAGPLFNILMVIICLAVWWIFPNIYVKTQIFAQANLSLAIFNLLPIFPLDAGRMLYVSLKSKMKKKTAIKIMKTNSLLAVILFAVLFFISVFKNLNLNYLFIISFILMSFNFDDLKIDSLNFLEKKDKKFLEVKSFITKESDLNILASKISPNYFSQFYILDNNGNIISKLSESEVIKKFLKTK